jgi:hypothetical protein
MSTSTRKPWQISEMKGTPFTSAISKDSCAILFSSNGQLNFHAPRWGFEIWKFIWPWYLSSAKSADPLSNSIFQSAKDCSYCHRRIIRSHPLKALIEMANEKAKRSRSVQWITIYDLHSSSNVSNLIDSQLQKHSLHKNSTEIGTRIEGNHLLSFETWMFL